jgi:beta-galactosidase/beta-glucuronidase
MENDIKNVTVQTRRLDPVEAELELFVELETVTSQTKLQGRLVGPRCPGTTTIEVAYPLRERRRESSDGARIVCRVVIPEPSLWEPQTPFVYEGIVELWEGATRCDQAQFSTGLRMAERA